VGPAEGAKPREVFGEKASEASYNFSEEKKPQVTDDGWEKI